MNLFTDIKKRTEAEKLMHKFLIDYTGLDLNNVSGWKLAKVTDGYFNDIKKYENTTDEEETFIYLMALHDAEIFNLLENEVLLSLIIKLIKHEESLMASDGYKAWFRKEIRERINSWVRIKVLR
jgi:hypothetical protein